MTMPITPKLLAYIRRQLPDARWVAVDADGGYYAYTHKPKQVGYDDVTADCWYCDDVGNEIFQIANTPWRCEDWQDTLTELPSE